MSNTPFPKEAELRNWASRGMEANGYLSIDRMPRLRAAAIAAEEQAKVRLSCYKDEQHRYVADISAEMVLTLQCQRCLEACRTELNTHSLLCIVWTEEASKDLPGSYDPLITGDVSNLHELVEDELLLSLPAVAMHEEDCSGGTPRDFGDLTSEIVEQTVSPFSGLDGLLKASVETKGNE